MSPGKQHRYVIYRWKITNENLEKASWKEVDQEKLTKTFLSEDMGLVLNHLTLASLKEKQKY